MALQKNDEIQIESKNEDISLMDVLPIKIANYKNKIKDTKKAIFTEYKKSQENLSENYNLKNIKDNFFEIIPTEFIINSALYDKLQKYERILETYKISYESVIKLFKNSNGTIRLGGSKRKSKQTKRKSNKNKKSKKVKSRKLKK
jgi:hypothetical protein